MTTAELTLLWVATLSSSAPQPFPWPPKKRTVPLPPFPPPVDYPTMLACNPPAGPDVNFVRANFCGVRVPGVPLLPNMAGYTLNPQPNPPLVMDLDVFKYRGDDVSIRQIFQQHQDEGLTHFQFSLGHAVDQGWSIDEIVALIQTWRADYGGFADVWFLGGDAFTNRDQDWAYWQPILEPWIDATAPVMDCYCVGWQLDQSNSPNGLATIIRGLGAAIRAIRTALSLVPVKAACHWVNDACAWWPSPGITDRFTFHSVLGAEDNLHRDYAQVDVNAPPAGALGGFQGMLQDLNRAHYMTPQGMQSAVLYEQYAQAEFDDPIACTDAYGCMRGYLGCCVPVSGFGNGTYAPDGSAV